MMDRQKQDELPKMQVGFINAICLPIYKELFELHPPFKPLYDGVLNNRDMWQSLADEAEAGAIVCGHCTCEGTSLMRTAQLHRHAYT